MTRPEIERKTAPLPSDPQIKQPQVGVELMMTKTLSSHVLSQDVCLQHS